MGKSRSDWTSILLIHFYVIFIQSRANTDWVAPPNLCKPSHKISKWVGPVPALPALPLQYSMKVEANILQNSWTTEVEEHYDTINQRASVSVTRNGSTTVSIFNFKANERYDVYPNGTCTARPTGTDFFGFMTRSKENKPAMATVNEVFRFGSQFNLTYIGKESVRGITVNHWTSCQYEVEVPSLTDTVSSLLLHIYQNWTQLGATFQLDFYFSEPDYTTASGRAEVPVRVVLNGSAHNVDMANERMKGMHTFLHIYEFVSFRGGPAFNEGVFQVPAGIVCSGRRDKKPLPAIPDQLEMSIEVVIPGLNRPPHLEYLLYDSNHKLTETLTSSVTGSDGNKSRIGNKDGDYLATISRHVVRDYNTGLVYDIGTVNQTCSVWKMPSPVAALSMSHGQNLLTVVSGDRHFVYQGQTTFRQMVVEAWALEQDGITTEVYFLPPCGSQPFQTMVGMFVKNKTKVDITNLPKMLRDVLQNEPEAKHLRESDSKTPQAMTGDQFAWGEQLEQFLDQHASQKFVNVFHYDSLRPDGAHFHISRCFQEEEISQVIVFVLANYDKDVHNNFPTFYNSLRDALSQSAGVSILHISNLAFTPFKHENLSTDFTKVTFTLLGAASNQGSKQKPLLEVKQNLETAITSGISFRVQTGIYSKDFTIHKTMYLLDFDKFLISNSKNSTFLIGSQTFDERHQKQTSVSEPAKQALGGRPVKSYILDSKYSPGTVAGISMGTFALGVIISLGVTYIVHRRKNLEETLLSDQPTN